MDNIIYGDQLLDAGDHNHMTQVQHIQISNEPMQTISTIKLDEVAARQGQGQRFITLRIDGQNRQVIQTFNSQQDLLMGDGTHQEIMVQTIPEQSGHQQHVQLQAVLDQHSGTNMIPSHHIELGEVMQEQTVDGMHTGQHHIQLQQVITSQALEGMDGQQHIHLTDVTGQTMDGIQGQQIEYQVMEEPTLEGVDTQGHMELQQVIQGDSLEGVTAEEQGIELTEVIEGEAVDNNTMQVTQQQIELQLEQQHRLEQQQEQQFEEQQLQDIVEAQPKLEEQELAVDGLQSEAIELKMEDHTEAAVEEGQQEMEQQPEEQTHEVGQVEQEQVEEYATNTEAYATNTEAYATNNEAIVAAAEAETHVAPTEAELEQMQFEAQLKKLEAPGPQFVMGPPSINSGDEEDEMDTSLIKGVIKGEGNDVDTEENYEGPELTQYEFKDLLNKTQLQAEEEDAYSDEGIVKDQVTLKSEKHIVAKQQKKRHSIISIIKEKVKTKVQIEDPQLLMDIHEEYNKLCIFCHSVHAEKCLIYDPMEKYEDIDQVGPPYTYGMPDQILMGLSRVYEGSYNLFARDDVPAFTQFGPLRGRIVEEAEFRKISLLEIDIENFWPIEASEHDELMIDNWLDTSDVEISNWLKFLLPESPRGNSPGYNIQRITKGGEIYFVTTEHILSGEELFMRAMEPPYRVYHNLKEMKRTEFVCGLNHTYKNQGNEVLNLENMVYYVRHHTFVHSIQPGVFSTAYVYNCPVCGEDCYTKAERLHHMNENHKDEENIKTMLKRDRRCYYCKKSFTTQAMLGHHMKYNHPKDEEVAAGYECPVCKARVKTKPTLKKHMQDSHRPINVSCGICGKVLKNKGTLKVHMMKIHAKKGMKQCILCEKTFSDLYQLRVHSLTHNKLRPFECAIELCEQSFTTKQCLQKHYRLKHSLRDEDFPDITRNMRVQDMPAYH